MDKDELDKILADHALWLNNPEEGKRAYLKDAYLRYANLSRVCLKYANIVGANLSHADLRGADLRRASLSYSNLRGADLKGTNLTGADLTGASLYNTMGNGDEVRTFQAYEYVVNITSEVIQIGCKQYPIEEWWAFTDEEIYGMDGESALDWWKVWKPILQAIVEAEA